MLRFDVILEKISLAHFEVTEASAGRRDIFQSYIKLKHLSWPIKLRYSKKANKFEKTAHFVLAVLSNIKKGGRFLKFCGLLTISEL